MAQDTGGGTVFRSDDGAKTFRPVLNSPATMADVVVSPSGREVFAGGDAGVFAGDGSGRHWPALAGTGRHWPALARGRPGAVFGDERRQDRLFRGAQPQCFEHVRDLSTG